MLSTELQPHAQELPEERRKASRFRKEPESSYAVLLHPQREEMLAEVHNESLGGLAVFLAGDSAFAVGQELDVIYLGSFSRATVLRVEPQRDGRVLIAFDCEPLLPREWDDCR